MQEGKRGGGGGGGGGGRGGRGSVVGMGCCWGGRRARVRSEGRDGVMAVEGSGRERESVEERERERDGVERKRGDTGMDHS